jgi:PRA1 family protein
MFLGVTGPSFCFAPDAFTPPVKKLDKSTPEKFKSRLRLNFAFFLSNYALVVAGVACVVCLLHPGMLLALMFVWALWYGHHFLISNEIVVGGTNIGTLISIQHRSNAIAIITCTVIAWKCLVPAVIVVVISGIIVLSHAMLRDPKQIDVSSSGGAGGYRPRGTTGSADSDHEESDDSGERSHESEVLVDKPGSV